MKEAMFWNSSEKRCELCARRCMIAEGAAGFCRVRKNIKGKLYSLNYGKLCSVAVDPIEKKPFFHFAPGSHSFSISTVGCNFRCNFCCNFEISQEWEEIWGKEYTPKDVVNLAMKQGTQGISYTYTEPTIQYEFAYDTAKLASKAGLYNTFVTNGYTMPEPIRKISKYLDAAVVDLKASGNEKFYQKFSGVPKTEPIYNALLAYKENKIFLEITDLLVPKYGDNIEDVRKLCKWIFDNLGAETPLHFIRFFSSYKLSLQQTDVAVLEKAHDIARQEGLKYVYLGNVSHKYENTFCPECGALLIERQNIFMTKFLLKDGCPKCGEKIPLAGKKWIK